MAWNITEGFKAGRVAKASRRALARGGEEAVAEAVHAAEKPFMHRVGHSIGNFGFRDAGKSAVSKGAGGIKRGLKFGALTGVVAAGAGALGLWAMSSRKKAKEAAREELANADMGADLQPPMPQPMMPQGGMMQDPNMMAAQDPSAMAQAQQTPMAAVPTEQGGPADGRQPNEWQNRVAAERGMGTMGQQEGPNQPSQNVVPESSVQDLGKSEGVPTQPTR